MPPPFTPCQHLHPRPDMRSAGGVPALGFALNNPACRISSLILSDRGTKRLCAARAGQLGSPFRTGKFGFARSWCP